MSERKRIGHSGGTVTSCDMWRSTLKIGHGQLRFAIFSHVNRASIRYIRFLCRRKSQWWIKGRIHWSPLFLDETEVQRAEKNYFFLDRPPLPLIPGSGWPPLRHGVFTDQFIFRRILAHFFPQRRDTSAWKLLAPSCIYRYFSLEKVLARVLLFSFVRLRNFHIFQIKLLTDTDWIQWVLLCTRISNKSDWTLTPVRANGVITNVIGSTSIWRLTFV